jgi:uncharacterized membrane protein YfcA
METVQVAEVMAAGAAAGVLGTLLGIGGGVFLVPFLVTVVSLPFAVSRGVSLMTVIATSSAVASAQAGRQFMNVRLAMLLQAATVVGGLSGGLTSRFIDERMLIALFAFVTILVALVMIHRLQYRNVIFDGSVTPGMFGGAYFEQESNQHVVYETRRLPLALLAALAAGNVSSLLGIGGGILLVPALNAFCSVPMRVAAATSAFMIGVTAVSAVPIYYAHGEVVPHYAAAAVLGVLLGSRAGVLLSPTLPSMLLKVMMIAVLFVVAGMMLWSLR